MKYAAKIIRIILFFSSDKKIIQFFTRAIFKKNVIMMNALCHEKCSFKGFEQKITHYSELIDYFHNNQKLKNSLLKIKINRIKNGIRKKCRIYFNIAKIIHIEGHLKIEIDYIIKHKQITQVKVTLYKHIHINEDEKKWENFVDWISNNYGNMNDIYSDMTYAKKYMKSKKSLSY